MDLKTAMEAFKRLEAERETEVEDDPPTYDVRLFAGASRETNRRTYKVRVVGPGWPLDRDAWLFVMETATELDTGIEVDNGAMLLT